MVAGMELVVVVEFPGGAKVAVPRVETAPADWTEPDPPVVAIAMPPTKAATDSPAMAIVKRYFFTISHLS
jgi:hypothetical protein